MFYLMLLLQLCSWRFLVLVHLQFVFIYLFTFNSACVRHYGIAAIHVLEKPEY